MMKNGCLVIAIVALLGLSCIPSASAAKSLTKSFKVSVTLPSTVGISAHEQLSKGKVLAEIEPLLNLDYTVIVRNNEKMLLRTVVVQ